MAFLWEVVHAQVRTDSRVILHYAGKIILVLRQIIINLKPLVGCNSEISLIYLYLL